MQTIGNAIAGNQRVSTTLKLSEVKPVYGNALSAYVFCVVEDAKERVAQMSEAEINEMWREWHKRWCAKYCGGSDE